MSSTVHSYFQTAKHQYHPNVSGKIFNVLSEARLQSVLHPGGFCHFVSGAGVCYFQHRHFSSLQAHSLCFPLPDCCTITIIHQYLNAEAKREDMEMCGKNILWAKVQNISPPRRVTSAWTILQLHRFKLKQMLAREDAKQPLEKQLKLGAHFYTTARLWRR